MSLFLALLILSCIQLVQSNYCLTFDTCISMSDYIMECLNIPVDLPHQEPVPCTLTELQILMEDPEEIEYLENGQPNLTQLYSFISIVKTAKRNATFRPMMPYLFTIKITTATNNKPCFPPMLEQNVMIYCTPRNPTTQQPYKTATVDQKVSTVMQTVAKEPVTITPKYNLTANTVIFDNTTLPATTSATSISTMRTKDRFQPLPSTTSSNVSVSLAGIAIVDDQAEYDDNKLIDEHKARYNKPRMYPDYSNPSTLSTQPPSHRLNNFHIIEWFFVVVMIIVFVMCGVLTFICRRSLFQQNSVPNRLQPGSHGIEECTVFELLDREK